MQVRVTWEGNDDGSERILRLSKTAPRVWVFVEGPDGEPVASAINLRAHVRQTRRGQVVRWPFTKLLSSMSLCWLLSTRLGRYLFPSRAKVLCEPSPLAQPSFTIDRLPTTFLPYYLDLTVSLPHAIARAPQLELKLGKASVYIVPRGSWLVSNVCLILSALAAAYGTVLFMSFGADRLPDSLMLWGTTVAAIATPLVPVIGPLFSSTIRRLALDALMTSLLVVVAFALAAFVRSAQSPIYFENRASAAVELRKQVIVEPGGAAVVANDDLDPELKQYLDCMRRPGARDAEEGAGADQSTAVSAPCTLKKNHPFKAANLCLVRADSDWCTELASANWIAKLQRWMSLGKTVYVGCRSVGQLAADYLDEWKSSGSCKRDPELKVTRGLKEHLEVLHDLRATPSARAGQRGAAEGGAGGARAENKPCVEPRAEVDVRPFRGAVDPDADLELRELHLRWPDAMSGSLPSWRFSGNGKLAEVRLAPASNSDIKCSGVENTSARLSPYGLACNGEKDCAVLYAPRGQLIAKVQRGDQELGNLWCAAGASEIFAVRLRSRVKTFRVLAPGEGVSVRDVMSRYEVAAAGAGEWVFWCEDPIATAAGSQAPTRLEFVADVMLAEDWQPDHGWSWLVPNKSRIGKLLVQIDTHGQWGTLDCASQKDRTLHLLRGDLAAGDAFLRAWYPQSQRVNAGRKSAAPAKLLSTWTRYTETDLYSSWVWYCAHGEPSGKLGVTTRDGSGDLTTTGTFTRSGGVPCLIDPATGERVNRPVRLHEYSQKQKDEHSAFTRLQTWAQRGCDPARSYFTTIEGP
jgi:hypothetical protein